MATVMKLGVVILLLVAVAGFASATSARTYRSAANSFVYSSECDEEFLLSIANDSEGLSLSVLATDSNNDEEMLLHLASQKLPSGTQCGEGNFRCKNPLIIKEPLYNSTVVFVPLHNALLLVDLVLNDTGLSLEDYHLINLTRFNCSPITSFKILRSVYTVCLNIEESYLALLEIRLNSEFLTRTAIIGPLARNYFSIQSSSQISNFKHIELYNFHFIYFAYENFLYYFDPLNYVLNYAGSFHPSCTMIKELVYVGGDTLLGYCREGATIYFDLNFESWRFYQPYSSYGRPYVCPDHSKRVVVFLQDGHVRYNVSESKTIRLELIGDTFVSGECFGDSSGFHFVYVDQQEGTFVLNLTTFNFMQLSTQPCFEFDTMESNLKCTEIQVLNNQYLIMQQWGNLTDTNNSVALQTTVFDARNNFQIVTTINDMNSSTKFNPISIIANDLKSCPTAAPPNMPTMYVDATTTVTEITETKERRAGTNLPAASFSSGEVTVAIGISVAGLVLIMLMVVVTILLLILFIRHAESKPNSGHMIHCESTDAVVLTCSRKRPHNSSAITSDSTGLESITVDQCYSKEKIRVDDPQNKTVA